MTKKLILKSAMFATLILTALSTHAQEQEIRVFSHRGGRLEHDENTMQAFQASYNAGYRGFETDFRMTRDGHLIVTHDSSLERTTNGQGKLEEKTLSEIKALSTKKGNKMLTAEELVAWLKGKTGLYVEFEMKTKPEDLYPADRLAEYCEKLYATAMSTKPADALYVFTSSDTRALRYMQQHHPDANLLLITSKPCCQETIDLCKAMGINRLGATMAGTSREAVQKAHKAGLIVSLWPGSNTDDFMLGAYLGADYLCTDVPLSVKKFAKEKAPWIKVKY